jgi:hypothetical protein
MRNPQLSSWRLRRLRLRLFAKGGALAYFFAEIREKLIANDGDHAISTLITEMRPAKMLTVGGKTVIGARCKQSGMFWGEPGAENILALRCIHSSRRLDEFWKERLNAHAARNDSLALTE